MLLPFSECKNAVEMLVPLSHDSLTKKGVYNRVDKIIVKHYNHLMEESRSAEKANKEINKLYNLIIDDI